jgi:hypothetical protein
MKNKAISFVIVLVIAAIIVVIILDYSAKRPDRLGDNPYEYEFEEYTKVDPSLIGYRETRNYPLRGYQAGALDLYNNLLWIAGENTLQVISPEGVQQLKQEIQGVPTCLEVNEHAVFIGFENHVKKYSHEGTLLSTWESPGSKSVFTSLASAGEFLFVADAGNRRVLRYDVNGDLLGQFEGKAESNAGHGFIVPSASFDLVVNSFGELWVVNPGRHALENYTYEGQLRGCWQKGSMSIEGFSGCCNPAEIAVMEDGSFLTSEKHMVRIKIYDSSGELKTVVAPPDKFPEEGQAPEVVADANGIVYALDFDRNMIRIFEMNE